MTRRLQRRLTRAAIETGQSAFDTAVTLGFRLPIFANAFWMPTPAATTEWNLAVNEKLTAGYEGVMAASFAWQKHMFESAFRMPGALASAHAMLDIADKAMRPARKKVGANAKRLQQRKAV